MVFAYPTLAGLAAAERRCWRSANAPAAPHHRRPPPGTPARATARASHAGCQATYGFFVTAQVLFSLCGLWAFCFGACLCRRTSVLGESWHDGEEPQPGAPAGRGRRTPKQEPVTDCWSECLPEVHPRYPWESSLGALVRGAMVDGVSGCCCCFVAIAALCCSTRRCLESAARYNDGD